MRPLAWLAWLKTRLFALALALALALAYTGIALAPKQLRWTFL